MSRMFRGNLLLAITYAATGWLALQFAVPPGYAAPLFPPAGIALAAMLIRGTKLLPGVFAGSLIVQLLALSHSGIDQNTIIALTLPPLGATAQAWIGLWLTRRLIGLPQPLDSTRSIVRFVALIAPLSCLVSASIAMPALLSTGSFDASDMLFTWANWWAGDTLGVLIMVPLLMAFLGEPASDWRPRRMVVAVPMIVALTLLFMTFLLISDWEKNRLQSEFDQDAKNAGSLIEKRLEAQLDQIVALERFAAVTPKMTREQWRDFVMPLLDRHAGTQNFGWSPLVLDAERTDFEARMQASGFPKFHILGRNVAGQTFIAEPKSEYLPIVYVEPFDRNRSVFGLDPLVLEKTAQAARRSLREKAPAATNSIRLVQEHGDQRGIVVYQAVIDGHTKRQIGMISGVFRMDDTIFSTLAGHKWEEIDICLSESLSDGRTQRLFGPKECEQAVWHGNRVSFRQPIRFAGQTWELTASATPAYMNKHRSWVVWLTLLCGLLTTGVLGAFLLLTSGRTLRIEMLVDKRTRELAEAGTELERHQEELIHAQRIARLGSWETWAGNDSLRCSSELINMLNLTSDTAITDEQLLACIHPDDRRMLGHALHLVGETASLKSLDCRLDGNEEMPQILHFRIESDLVDHRLRIRGTAQDVTLARAAEAHIAYLAHFDVLTGLPNRTQWNERVQSELSAAERYKDSAAILFIDLDQFKAVNDSLGHTVGDQLLKAAAQRLTNCLRKHDFLARLGGDEFVILLPRLLHKNDAAQVARKLIEVLRPPVVLEEHELTVSASIGIATYPDDGTDADTLLKHADMAMYSAKDRGRNTFHFFENDMDARAHERLKLENDLRRAIDRDELLLHYQPQVAINGYPLGCEALVRWNHPTLGMLPPLQFITVAEESGLIVPLGDWVLRTACLQQVAWARQGMAMVVAVNISALQFRQADFTDSVRQILDETGADPACIELELTESALMMATPELLNRMKRLRDWGLRLALDDFGTGYSSLSYLKRLPIQHLKLDRSFVTGLPADAEDVAIASATISLAHNLGMDVVAEGVEEEAQRDFLSQRGCEKIQGFLFSRPLPEKEFIAWYERQMTNLNAIGNPPQA